MIVAPADVACCLFRGQGVRLTPRGKWKDAFLRLGFSHAAVESYARMTAVSLGSGF